MHIPEPFRMDGEVTLFGVSTLVTVLILLIVVTLSWCWAVPAVGGEEERLEGWT